MNYIKAYKAIAEFVSAMHGTYRNNKPLALYNRLIVRTPITDNESIKKHVDIFQKYLATNKQQLTTGKLSDLKRIIYKKESIYIDLPEFIKISDKEDLLVIKNHLLTISLVMNPADEMISNILEHVEQGGKEGEFLGDIMGTVQEMMGGMDFDENANPMEGIMKMVGNIFPKMMSGMQQGMQSGDLDPTKLLGGIQKMLSGIGGGDMSNLNPPSMRSHRDVPSDSTLLSGVQINIQRSTPVGSVLRTPVGSVRSTPVGSVLRTPKVEVLLEEIEQPNDMTIDETNTTIVDVD